MTRLTTLLRQADPLQDRESGLSARARAELRALVGPEAELPVPAPAPRRRIRRTAVLGGALLAVVLVVAVPLLPRPVQGLPTPVAASPTGTPGAAAATGRWVATASGPLSGRRDAVTAWVAGSFLVIGGTTARPCADPTGCGDDPARRSDGARYTPATDSWTTIADAPVPLGQGAANPYPVTATVGHTLYVLQGGAFLAYDADADRWTTLVGPPEAAHVAGVAGNAILAFPASVCGDDAATCRGTDRMAYLRYDPDAAAWTRHATGLAVPSSVYGAAVVGAHLVVSWLEKGGLGAASIDLGSGTVSARSAMSTGQRPMPVAAGGWAVWPRDTFRAWLFDPATLTTPDVALPAEPGALWVRVGGSQRNPPIVTAGMIALRGQFYDPRTERWSIVPTLPVPAQDPVIVGGGDAVLACNGWDGSRYATSCHLLRPDPASRIRP